MVHKSEANRNSLELIHRQIDETAVMADQVTPTDCNVHLCVPFAFVSVCVKASYRQIEMKASVINKSNSLAASLAPVGRAIFCTYVCAIESIGVIIPKQPH